MATRSNSQKPTAARPASKPEAEAPTAPAKIDLPDPDIEAQAAPEAAEKVEVETSVLKKLARKTDSPDAFVPTPPADLQKAAERVAVEDGFDMDRGRSIGARLMAKARKMV